MIPDRKTRGGASAVLLLALVSAVPAGGLAPLPEPLTLEDALALTGPMLPSVELALAEQEASAASLAGVESESGVRLDLVGRLRGVKTSYVSEDPDQNDSSASLALRKRLYDFGYSRSREAAARLTADSSETRYRDARQQARLQIMRSFFDVILADLQFARDNEAMAGAFLAWDRARDRAEFGTVSDVELLRLESEYRVVLLARNESEQLQRAARSRLALAMGRPGDLVASVIRPRGPDIEQPVPEYDALVAGMLAGNPELLALRAEVQAAEAQVDAARAGHGPVLSAELDATVRNRSTNSTHPLGAALVLEVPLLTGGARDAAVAAARAALRGSRARLVAREHALRQEVLELWQRLGSLRTRIGGLRVRGDYRELYLDRSRALYEMEVKTDLGDAMTEISAWRLDMADAEFDWLMVEAQLAALAGRLAPEEQTR